LFVLLVYGYACLLFVYYNSVGVVYMFMFALNSFVSILLFI